jgi:hypothetical protein
MPPTDPKANIEVTLEGLQLVFVDSEKKQCTVGVLRDAPAGHDFLIEIVKKNPAGGGQVIKTLSGADIKSELAISVSNTSQTGITLRKMDAKIDRRQDPVPDENKDSFLWVVDFERDIYQKPIGAKKDGFTSLLTINHGELLTRFVSDNKLKIKKGPKGKFKVFGHVATQTGIDIVLDQPNSQAVFMNGDETVMTFDKDSSFEIIITRVCGKEPGGNDGDAYYTAIGHLVPDNEKIFFSSTRLPVGASAVPNTPDASCLGGSMSRSHPST